MDIRRVLCDVLEATWQLRSMCVFRVPKHKIGTLDYKVLSLMDRRILRSTDSFSLQILQYFDLYVTHGLFLQITVPIRECNLSSSLINQMFSKLNNPKQNLLSCVIKSSLSVHYPYLTILDILQKPKHRPNYVKNQPSRWSIISSLL